MNNIMVYDINENFIMDVLKINTLCFNPPWSLTTLKSEIENKFSKYIVVKQNDKVIGYAGIWIIIDEAHITSIAVHPEYRCIGAGDILIKKVIDICKLRKIPAITLEVRENNIPAINLYKKYGFSQEGLRKNYYSDNTNAILMWKKDVLS
ncbi:ribosomal protein S18-alanine N-acetyltransferase [Clostridium aestuarii]|uniref:[Ribosomal protein bS18]-alanine N-acetyltransferase n=1 Tax=Clostridium aestuarii TaxID=338193 RepID=A0ABT4D347_9CLOT|nr:ribosomal protein S18-alanine N-acetyltransferase [Clostridium aestuarii]MCY6485656.1 ribosomal protein S18-alanine N-acetyltransferase [Clostridium aestuarii]